MKTIQTIITATVLSFSATGIASSMQINCSNAQGSVQIKDDFRDQELRLIEVQYAGEETSSNETVLKRGEYKTNALESTQINSIQSGKCEGDLGWYSVRSFYYQNVQLQRTDGGEFSSRIEGTRLSDDKKTLEVHMMCERFVTGMRPCQSK